MRDGTIALMGKQCEKSLYDSLLTYSHITFMSLLQTGLFYHSLANGLLHILLRHTSTQSDSKNWLFYDMQRVLELLFGTHWFLAGNCTEKYVIYYVLKLKAFNCIMLFTVLFQHTLSYRDVWVCILAQNIFRLHQLEFTLRLVTLSPVLI